MSDKNTGGPAFPDGSTNEWGNATKGGMTLRDYFAAKAMQAIGIQVEDENRAARWAYAMADAMLRAREE